MVLYDYVVDGVIVDAQIPYPVVLVRTGLKDQVGLTERGYVEYHAPVVEPVITPEMIAMSIRNLRSHSLQDSDWTQAVDSPLSDSKKAEWAIYRQALRDMPVTYMDATDFTEIVPPTQPS